jgi:hypothetical protein
MNNYVLLKLLKSATKSSALARQSVSNLTLPPDYKTVPNAGRKSYYLNQEILNALRSISDSLANSYFQITRDFDDENRISWAGTAHEIRELLRKILEYLAPTKAVITQPWYQKLPSVSGPTQKQRVRYILSLKNGDSKQQKVVQDIDIINDKIGELVRDVYGRASDAAHRSKSKTEAFKILRYFEAFAYDLLI